MKRITLRSKILGALAESPSTAAELGSILLPGESARRAMRRCSAYCCILRAEGKLKVVGKIPRDKVGGNRIMSNLWAISKKAA
jgi:hypothetical protein